MARDCNTLKNGEQVVFYRYCEIYKEKIPEIGTVESLNSNRKEVHVNWLEGYKDRHDVIPFSDMIAVYNKDGEMMYWPGISGPSDLLMHDYEQIKEEESEQENNFDYDEK